MTFNHLGVTKINTLSFRIDPTLFKKIKKANLSSLSTKIDETTHKNWISIQNQSNLYSCIKKWMDLYQMSSPMWQHSSKVLYVGPILQECC